MDIIYLGHSSFLLRGKQTTLVTDPYEEKYGLKLPKTEADIVTVSHDHADHSASNLVQGNPFVVKGPGEYEIKGVKIIGVDSFHDEKEGKDRGKNTIYNIQIDGINVCHLGDFGQKELSSQQQEVIGNVDILLVPTGGNYTIDAQTATEIAALLETKIVIPMHYQDGQTGLQLDPVDKFLKETGSEKGEKEAKLTVDKEKLPTEQQVVLMEKKF